MIRPTASPYLPALRQAPEGALRGASSEGAAGAMASDGVTLSGGGAPPVLPGADLAAAEAPAATSGQGALLLAAAMAGLAVAGTLVPGLGSLATPSVSQTQVQGVVDLAKSRELVGTLVTYAETSATVLPKVNVVHGQWRTDTGAMQTTIDDVAKHVDALMRAPRGKEAPAHHKAVVDGLARLDGQAEAFRGRLAQEAPVVDEFLAKNRDNLHEVGATAWNLKGSADLAARARPFMSPERKALREVAGAFKSGAQDAAMAAERAATSRQEGRTLREDMETLQKFLAQVRKAVDRAANDPKAMGEVEKGVLTLQKAVSITSDLAAGAEQDVVQAGLSAHRGALDLKGALRGLEEHVGGSGVAPRQP